MTAKKLSQFGHDVRKGGRVNAATRPMTGMTQRKKNRIQPIPVNASFKFELRIF